MFIAEVLCSHIDENLFDEKDKIHFEKANLISYSHGEYFSLSKEAIGKFGYSVMKKRKRVKGGKKWNLINFNKKFSTSTYFLTS